jgi:large subunit ribosomal protein L28
MSRTCIVTGKRPLVGNKVSHSNRKSKTRQLANLQVKRFWLEDERRFVTLRLSARAMRTIDKRGLGAVVRDLRARGEKI